MNNEPDEPIGRTKPARLPDAPGSAFEARARALAVENLSVAVDKVEGVSAAIESNALGSPGGSASAPRGVGGPGAVAFAPVPPRLASVPMPIGRSIPVPQVVTGRDEQEILLSVLKLLDRLAAPGTLSPVERALVSGAKVAFRELSAECDKLLKRTVKNMGSPSPEIAKSPEFAIEGPPKPVAGKATRRAAGKAKSGGPGEVAPVADPEGPAARAEEN